MTMFLIGPRYMGTKVMIMVSGHWKHQSTEVRILDPG